MKKKNAKSRAIIIYALCGGLIVSLFSPVTTGFAEDVADAVDQITTKILGKPDTAGMLEVPNLQLSTVATQNDELAKAEQFSTDEQVVQEDVEIRPQINQKAAKSLTVDTKPQDLFNLSQEQMEELINKGFTVEDIYKLDELANRLLVEPQVLIERKEKSGESWTSWKPD